MNSDKRKTLKREQKRMKIKKRLKLETQTIRRNTMKRGKMTSFITKKKNVIETPEVMMPMQILTKEDNGNGILGYFRVLVKKLDSKLISGLGWRAYMSAQRRCSLSVRGKIQKLFDASNAS